MKGSRAAERAFPTIPEAGDYEAIMDSLAQLGIPSRIGYGSMREIRFRCPYCQHVGSNDQWTASMNVETTQWICHYSGCAREDGTSSKGNLLTLRREFDPAYRSYHGYRATRPPASRGGRDTIAEQVARTLQLLGEGRSATEIVAALVAEFPPMSERTAYNRLASARGKRLGRRTDSASRLARRRRSR